MSKKINNNVIINQFKEIHGDLYDYSLVDYVNARTKVKIICKEHGVFEQRPDAHKKGQNCPKCVKINQNKNLLNNQDDVINQFKEIHGDLYDYSLVDYVNARTKVKIICKEHGVFEQTPANHKKGTKCLKCVNKLKINSLNNVINQFKEIHGDLYDYSLVDYVDARTKLDIICKEHGVFEQTSANHKQNKGCPKCCIQVSKPEDEIVNFILDLGIKRIIRNDRTLLSGKEIDIYLPDFNLAIEFNGLIWHSRGTTFPRKLDFSIKKKHSIKTNECDKQGINLLHIFENEWSNPLVKDKWKSVIRNKLKLNENVIFGRKTIFKEITFKEANEFCEENHLQGKGVSGLNYGLFYLDDLVSVMTFSKARFKNKNHPNVKFEMIRYCNKKNYSVVGAASKLLKNFRKLNPGGIVSYANRRWSDGHLYKTLGFTLSHISTANYFYFNKEVNKHFKLWSRNKFQKHKLHKQLAFFDDKLTEEQNVFKNDYRQIHDSGNYVFILNKKKELK